MRRALAAAGLTFVLWSSPGGAPDKWTIVRTYADRDSCEIARRAAGRDARRTNVVYQCLYVGQVPVAHPG